MGVVKEYIDESKDNGSTKVLVQYRSWGKTLIWTDEYIDAARQYEVGQSVEIRYVRTRGKAFFPTLHTLQDSESSWVAVLLAWPLIIFLLFDLLILWWLGICKMWDEVGSERKANIMIVVYAVAGILLCLLGTCMACSCCTCCEDSTTTDEDAVVEMLTTKADIPAKPKKDSEATPLLLELPNGSGDQAQ